MNTETDAQPTGADASYDVAVCLAGLEPSTLPEDVVDATKRYIMDCLGVAVAGVHAPGSAATLRLISHWGGRPQATVWGSGIKVPAALAGFTNTQLARALDFDDVYGRTFAHLTCSVLPAALAMAEATGRRDGRTLIAAVAAGRDLICRLGLSTGTASTAGGRANMYQFNAFAVAAVAAMYLRLPPPGIVSALGLVYGQGLSSKQGLIEGAHVPPVHQALATQLGIQCAYLAAEGLVGARGVFEGRFGYFPQYEGGRFERQTLLDGLGQRFLGLDSGIKKYPVCMQSHTAIDATIRARARLGDPRAEDIRQLRVGLNHEALNMVYEPVGGRRQPASAAQVQYSLPWVVALAAVHGALPLTHLTPDPARDGEVARLAQRVTAEIDPAIDAESSGRFSPAWVELLLRDGRRARTRVEVPPGSPGRALSWEEVEAKFRACWFWNPPQPDRAKALGAPPALERQVELLRHLEGVEDVGEVAAGTAMAAGAVLH